MKRLQRIHRILFLLLALLPVTKKSHAVNDSLTAYYDSVEVSLVTCSPHEEIYSLYGHTALRMHDLHTGEDLSFNYGVFNYNQDFFVIRFVFGKTDYELGIAPFPDFCKYYRRWGSQVSEQVLNLTGAEKLDIMRALITNYRPENRVYRYNFFYDNCATRARDIIERNVQGRIFYPPHQGQAPSFRQLIHQHTALHPWAATGNDLLLGLRADAETTQREQHFLPEYLENDVDGAVIQNPDGTQRPLVKTKRVIVPHGVQLVEPEFPLSPTACALVLLLLSALLALVEWRRRRTYAAWDALLMTLMGLAGILIVVMFFSEHPATSTNLQVLLLNPLHLFFVKPVVSRRPTRYWLLLAAMVALFAAGGFWQHYAEGMYIVALSLLIRIGSHLKHDK